MMKIPVGKPAFDEDEVHNTIEVVRSGWVAKGKELEEFERKLAEYLGVKEVVTVNSGTAALEVALRAMGIENKEVITTATSCAPTANGIIHSGNTPVVIDVFQESYNLDFKEIEKHITEKTGAILPVHIYGRPANLDKILEIAKKHNLPVIEDCAQSMGAKFRGRQVGSFGDVGCFSLNINKIITTGEGGFLATNNPKIAENARMIRNYGRDPSGSDYCYTHFGHNFKFTNLQAALGLAQLKKIDQLIEARRKNAYHLISLLKDLPGIQLPGEDTDEFSVFFSFPILLHKPGLRDQLKKFLEEKGIEVRTMFRPMTDQPYYVQRYGKRKENFPTAEYLGENGFYVGCYPSLTKEEIRYLAASIREGLNQLGA